MTVLVRTGLAGLLLLVAATGIGPSVKNWIDTVRISRSAPLQTSEVRRKLALLPADAKQAPAALQLQQALTMDAAWLAEEEAWSRGVGALLTEEQRQSGQARVDLQAPTVPPPRECPGVDGDISRLAQVLLQKYGYEGVPVPVPPTRDPWIGTDRRSRTRALIVLAEQAELQPEQAQQLLSSTLNLLHLEIQRAENLSWIKKLLPVVMGEG